MPAKSPAKMPVVREFATGANRDRVEGKLDYLGFTSAKADRRFAAYMNKNRRLADGSLRDGDNWKRGIPLPVYADSFARHAQEVREAINDAVDQTGVIAARLIQDAPQDHPALLAIDETMTAMRFNVDGWLHERVKAMDALGNPYPGKRGEHGKPPMTYPEFQSAYADWVAAQTKSNRGRRH
jgi:hypothetical protein